MRIDAASTEVDILAWTNAGREERADLVTVEEPLEIRLAGFDLAVTMRTPGDDLDLVRGFVVTEGILGGIEEIASLNYCPDNTGSDSPNVVNVNVKDSRVVDPQRWTRHFYASSSCGICGKASIEAVRLQCSPITWPGKVKFSTLRDLASTMERSQQTFHMTGGLHGAALFDTGGKVLSLREDVGRHNAVDKVIGAGLAQGIDLKKAILLVSGRASFEVTQKALMARIPVVAAISAPSTLAVELAREGGMTLIGFLRPGRFNIYAGKERIEA